MSITVSLEWVLGSVIIVDIDLWSCALAKVMVIAE